MINIQDIKQSETYHFLRFQMILYMILSILLISGIVTLYFYVNEKIVFVLGLAPIITSIITIFDLIELNRMKKYATTYKAYQAKAVAIESSFWSPRLVGIVFEFTNHSGHVERIPSYHVFRSFEVREILGQDYIIYVSIENYYAPIKDLIPMNMKETSIIKEGI